MRGLFANILLALAWTAVSGTLSAATFFAGLILGYLVLALVQEQIPMLNNYAQRLPRTLRFAGFLLWELIRANWRVAYDVATPVWYMRPGVIAMPLAAKTDLEITLVANFISLTPGTLSLDVSDDRQFLYVHSMFLQDEAQFRADLKELERRTLEILR